ncbi:cytochrome [Frankia sp. CcI49]|uniref:cytochrome P450 n=1 Tax=Frankia sp. CcI49 TaxID=1745382 RepID=UPI00097769D8|nr:cytochrome P450 [Frankia sp. CcI49]ONH60568.1 cytochrome [Frankia sp. CcI49]
MTAAAESTTIRFNPFSAEFREDPYPIYRRLREHRPVHRTLGMWVLTRHADVHGVLRDRRFGVGVIPGQIERAAARLGRHAARPHGTDPHDANPHHANPNDANRHAAGPHEAGPHDLGRIGRLAASSLVFTDDPEHGRLRALVNRVFTASAVNTLRPRINAVVDRLLSPALELGGMDAVGDFAAPLPIAVLGDWMGLPDDLRDQVGGWTHDIRFLLEPGLLKADDLTRVRDVVDTFVSALGDVVGERRASPREDLISRLLAARTGSGDRLGDEEIAFVCIMCFVAGLATTTSLIGNALLALLSDPAQDALLHRRPELAPDAVAEALRYDSPLQLTKRLASGDAELGGQRVKAGDELLLCLGAANRDPAVFDRPDSFDIGRAGRGRTGGGHLAFGHGMHGCLGGPLAQAQAEIALESLYRRAGRIEPAADQGPEPSWQAHSFIIRGLTHLPVALGDVR